MCFNFFVFQKKIETFFCKKIYYTRLITYINLINSNPIKSNQMSSTMNDVVEVVIDAEVVIDSQVVIDSAKVVELTEVVIDSQVVIDSAKVVDITEVVEVVELVLESNLRCTMCFNAKRDDFNTHSIRDSTGKVTCPYLLSIICRYCKTSGHTVSYCPVLKAKDKTFVKKLPYKTSDGFISVNISKHTQTSGYIKKNTDVKADSINICNMFAAIDIDATVNDNMDIITKFVSDKSPGWKNISLPLKYKAGTSWADQCDDCSDDE